MDNRLKIKKRMVSGIKPTGSSLTLGNYLGAIKRFVKYQNEYDLYLFIADLHALTLPIDPNELRENTKNLLATYLAAGLDYHKCVIFKQSEIPEHTQLEWILTCNTDLPDLTKMPQYKNYKDTHKKQSVPSGMLMYPSLMNADILLYASDSECIVPVGLDQKPHVDLTRFVAENFNKRYPNTFTLPVPLIAEQGAKIMSLSDPTKKMSKSESDIGTIYLSDDEETIYKKIKKATTDGEGKIYYDPENKPGISNLLTIYACIKNISIKDAEKQFTKQKDYGIFKKEVAKAVCDEIIPLQNRIKQINQRFILNEILEEGRQKAELIATNKLNEVYRKVGLK